MFSIPYKRLRVMNRQEITSIWRNSSFGYQSVYNGFSQVESRDFLKLFQIFNSKVCLPPAKPSYHHHTHGSMYMICDEYTYINEDLLSLNSASAIMVSHWPANTSNCPHLRLRLITAVFSSQAHYTHLRNT